MTSKRTTTASSTARPTCNYPGCGQPAAPAEKPGRPPEYCAGRGHTRASAWKERRRLNAEKNGTTISAADDQNPVTMAKVTGTELLWSLRQAADSYERAAREPSGRIPRPTEAGNQLRHAARIMATYARISGDRTNEWATVTVRLAALVEAVAELRDAQQRAAQARAALVAAQQLHVVRFAPPAGPPGPPRARSAADLAAQSFTGPRYHPAAHGKQQETRTRPPGPQTGTAPPPWTDTVSPAMYPRCTSVGVYGL
jgi:hypothetical protein